MTLSLNTGIEKEGKTDSSALKNKYKIKKSLQGIIKFVFLNPDFIIFHNATVKVFP